MPERASGSVREGNAPDVRQRQVSRGYGYRFRRTSARNCAVGTSSIHDVSSFSFKSKISGGKSANLHYTTQTRPCQERKNERPRSGRIPARDRPRPSEKPFGSPNSRKKGQRDRRIAGPPDRRTAGKLNRRTAGKRRFPAGILPPALANRAFLCYNVKNVVFFGVDDAVFEKRSRFVL